MKGAREACTWRAHVEGASGARMLNTGRPGRLRHGAWGWRKEAGARQGDIMWASCGIRRLAWAAIGASLPAAMLLHKIRPIVQPAMLRGVTQ